MHCIFKMLLADCRQPSTHRRRPTNQRINESTQTALNSKASYLSYRETGYFSKLVSDYIDGAESLQPFLQFPADIEGVKKAIAARQNAGEVHREPLVSHIQQQYAGIDTSDKVRKNISSLINGNAYTICTAHQPNLFTGHMYFVYKVLHAIKLADSLSK